MKTAKSKPLAVVLLAIFSAFACARAEDAQKQIPQNEDPTRQATAKAGSPEDAAAPEYPVTLFYSSGDAIVEYDWMPMDSEATCKAGFEILKKIYNCDRILWREGDNDWVAKYNAIRKDSPWLGDLMTDALRINREFKNTEHACRAAEANGIRFWGIYSLYDYCGKAECGAGGRAGTGSFWGLDPMKESHPEYCLWDRARITYMTGIIEYGDPGVRKEYVRRTDEMFQGPWSQYEGMFMYSFIENSEAHYTDEYIYSDYAVADFKKRYGVDVRTQEFDLEKYYAMRGEYITQYLRDIRPVYKKFHKKLAVALNSENMEWPQLWLCGAGIWPKDAPEPFILQQGKVKMDWRTWVKEGLVDELHVWGGTAQVTKLKDVKELLAATEGTGIKVTVFSTQNFPENEQSLYEKGVRRVISPVTGEKGDTSKKYQVEDIGSQDTNVLLGVLTQARDKKLELPMEKLTGLLLGHPNPLVRRQAAHTIGALKLKTGVAALEEAATNEPEGSVKAMVFDALGKVNGPGSVAAMAQGFAKVNTFPARMALRDALAAMGPERYADVAKSYETKDSYYRTVLLQSMTRRDGTPEYLEVIRKAINDPNDKVRWWAAFAFGYSSRSPENMEILYKALDDPCGAVQSRAAMTMCGMLPKMSQEMKRRFFEKLMARYQEFGDGCLRDDADWGWRPIGEAIRDGFGSQGKNALLGILNEGNSDLAKLTWRVFFQPNENQWRPITRKAMERRYRFYPGGAEHGKCTLADVYAANLPERDRVMLENGFEDQKLFSSSTRGTVGTADATGRWDLFGENGISVAREQARGGHQSLKVVRGGNPLTARFAPGGSGATFEASAWFYREKSSFSITANDTHGKEIAMACVLEDGEVCLRDFSGNSWQRSKSRMASDAWVKITLHVNLLEGKYTAGIQPANGAEQRLDISMATPSEDPLGSFGVSPNAPPNGVTYVDDVRIVQKGVGNE